MSAPTPSRLAAISTRRPWLVVLVWVGLTVLLNVAVPQLEEVAGRDSSPVVPPEAPSQRAAQLMGSSFGSAGSQSVVVVAMERDGARLGPADRRYSEQLGDALAADPQDVVFVQDLTDPALRRALTSEDQQARYLLVGITGATGAPTSLRQVEAVREIVRAAAPPGLDVVVTGPTATVVDATLATESSVLRITVVTIGLIALILLLVYRSLVLTALILGVVGIGLGLGRAAVALCGDQGLFTVSTFSGTFLTAVVLGAGTDYAVFLIARYHEQRRLGLAPADAAAMAATRIGSVITGSAVTVILATLAMSLAQVGFFTTTGPAVAVSIAVNLALALTLTPALLVLAGRRGLGEPRGATTPAGWQRVARLVMLHPVRVAVGALTPLVLLAALLPLADLSYDFREPLPDSAESNRGYALLARHFPVNEVLPDYVVLRADRDLRTSADLALLERAAAAVAQHPQVDLVRTLTRPAGTPIAQASLAGQSGRVGGRLEAAGRQVADGVDGARRLSSGAGALADGAELAAEGAGRLADGASAATEGAARIAAAGGRLAGGLDRLLDGAERAASGSGDLRRGMATLADGLAAGYDQVALGVDGLGQVYDALDTASLGCDADPVCRQAREGLRVIYEAERDQLLPGLKQAAAAARALARGAGDLEDGLARLRDGLEVARSGTRQLAEGQRTFAARLGDLQGGAADLASGTDRVAQGTRRLAEGTTEVAASLPQLRAGLARAAALLRSTDRQLGEDPLTSGFYLPPAALTNPDFRDAARLFISDDGRVVRFVVLGTTDAFGEQASQRARAIERIVTDSLRDTRLADVEVSVTGVAATNADLREYVADDLRTIALGSLLAVFLVLLLLLRSPVAATVLMGTVVLSWLAAMGVATLVWQYLLGIPLDWTVAAVSLVILVAVGADYNLLLTKRIHEEAPDGSADGVARATAATGSVITTAGVIFAVSMLALLAGQISTIGQVGSTIAVGLLLDTFVVRSLLVPALATLLGPRLWWPRSTT
ncbi:MMPL family transporter [Nocardioides sp.]|uniref:MMPL family transporter n=1 Tax=Nocardioides sp. TaxID=35761 RepID=UPI0035188A90